MSERASEPVIQRPLTRQPTKEAHPVSARESFVPIRRRVIDIGGMVAAAAVFAFVATRGEVVSWLWR